MGGEGQGSLQSVGPGEALGKVHLLLYFSPSPRPVCKDSSQGAADVEAVLAGIAPGRRELAFSKLQKELSEKRPRPAGRRTAWDQLA